MTTTPIDGWCQCGYRRSAHKASDKFCPVQPSDGTAVFRANPGNDLAESLHEQARAHRASGEQIGMDL